jgi:hypothetical protein
VISEKYAIAIVAFLNDSAKAGSIRICQLYHGLNSGIVAIATLHLQRMQCAWYVYCMCGFEHLEVHGFGSLRCVDWVALRCADWMDSEPH